MSCSQHSLYYAGCPFCQNNDMYYEEQEEAWARHDDNKKAAERRHREIQQAAERRGRESDRACRREQVHGAAPSSGLVWLLAVMFVCFGGLGAIGAIALTVAGAAGEALVNALFPLIAGLVKTAVLVAALAAAALLVSRRMGKTAAAAQALSTAVLTQVVALGLLVSVIGPGRRTYGPASSEITSQAVFGLLLSVVWGSLILWQARRPGFAGGQ